MKRLKEIVIAKRINLEEKLSEKLTTFSLNEIPNNKVNVNDKRSVRLSFNQVIKNCYLFVMGF